MSGDATHTAAPISEEPPGLSPPTLAVAPALGSAVKRGMSWMVFNTLATKGLSFLAQVALGWLLSEGDFGIYAVTLAISSLTTILKDGGVRQLLVQRGEKEFESLVGPVFWMALAFNAGTAVLLAGAAPLAASLYGQPVIAPMLLVVAAAMPLSTPGAILQAKLTIDLRFGALARIAIGSAIVRYVGSVALAWAGVGPLSFVLPLIAISLFEWAASRLACRTALFTRAAHVRRWKELFHQSKWVLVGTVAICLVNSGAYLAIGFLVAKEIVGQYFFAYSLVVQVGALISTNVVQVLMPAVAKLIGEPARERAAVVRSLQVVMLVGAPASLALLPLFEPLELLLWRGKWAAAVPAVQWLAACYPLSVLMAVPLAVQLAHGWFRQWGLLLLLDGLGTIGAGAAGAALGATAADIAIWTGGFTVLAGLVIALAALPRIGLSVLEIARAGLPAWALSLAAAGAVAILDSSIAWPAQQAWVVLRLAAGAAALGAFTFVLVRAILPSHLRESAMMAPVRFRPMVLRLMLLPP
jgi:O-antigen/teichoic acid export membrane protein